MARKNENDEMTHRGEGGGRVRRALSSISRLFRRGSQEAPAAERTAATNTTTERHTPVTQPSGARGARRPADIGIDVLQQTYTPRGASGKSSFRSDGADHQRDQEFAGGVGDERWNDEDRLTNKSGDPRIGTHGRSYEPGESRGSRN